MTEQVKCNNNKGYIDQQVSQITSAKCLDGFLAALLIWINKPHVANRRLVGTRLLSILTYKYPETDYAVQHFLDDMNKKFGGEDLLSPNDDSNGGQVEADDHQQSVLIPESGQTDITFDDLNSLSDSGHRQLVIVRDLLPKQLNHNLTLREVITFDRLKKEFKFYPLIRFDKHGKKSSTCNEIFYSFKFQESEQQNRIVLNVHQKQEKNLLSTMTYQWLQAQLLVKLSRWAGEDNLRTETTSLRTVSVDAYNRLYNELKAKYGPDLIRKWPERTDPQKFVYEDISIATFLLLIWEAERHETGLAKQSFVDLGCGNGLLVHLLTSEGHPGLGIDIQKRKIWDIYGPNTKLEVKALLPSAENLFPEYDWIIGNHSDELTPWIPVIAARSSYHTRYFVLPCCFHDFDQKFSEKSHGLSQYRTYLNYIRDIGKVCGFDVHEDILRIPSTKRVCFLGRKRTYSEDQEIEFDKLRSNFINGRCKRQKLETSATSLNNSHHHPSEPGEGQEGDDSSTQSKTENISECWTSDFQPRSLPKTTGMCKNVPGDIKTHIVDTVIEKLITAENGTIIKLSDGRSWHKGGVLPLSEIVSLFDSATLQLLKKENGGLQTLLKNFSHIFQVSGSSVQLRDYNQPWGHKSRSKNKDRTRSFKTALCWFHENHSDGCPLTQDTCTFAHGQTDLVPKKQHMPHTAGNSL